MTFAPKSSIRREQGRGGVSWIVAEHLSGYQLTISPYGGQVLSWIRPCGSPLLFLSKAATFEPGKAIRGGIPVVFPQFGKGELPPHGFARTALWDADWEEVLPNGTVSIGLSLRPDSLVRALWPHAFSLQLVVELSQRLAMTLRVTNEGTAPFSCSTALHSYFAVSDVSQCIIRGLSGLSYIDLLRGREVFREERQEVTLGGACDRIYRGAPSDVHIVDPAAMSAVRLMKTGFEDLVVWNPWEQGAKSLPDLREGAWRRMVCVEAGNIAVPRVLLPSETQESTQVLAFEPAG